ncbi:MAG TPA: hypothetical protein VKQ72_07365 [Aggregatilineales bacterium]|nr:hypothetical protein [Aggregatilineales bacterium]
MKFYSVLTTISKLPLHFNELPHLRTVIFAKEPKDEYNPPTLDINDQMIPQSSFWNYEDDVAQISNTPQITLDMALLAAQTE